MRISCLHLFSVSESIFVGARGYHAYISFMISLIFLYDVLVRSIPVGTRGNRACFLFYDWFDISSMAFSSDRSLLVHVEIFALFLDLMDKSLLCFFLVKGLALPSALDIELLPLIEYILFLSVR